MIDSNNRPKLTLSWRPRPEDPPARLDDFVETAPPAQRLVKVVNVGPVQVIDSTADQFARRMDNWRRTVSWGGNGNSSCCAAWASYYLKSRNKDGNGGEDNAPPRPLGVTPDELDGWLVEAAVRAMPVFEEKMVLRYVYVFKYPERWIKTKLLLRRTAVRLVKARAEASLQKILRNLNPAATILSNNSHAGVDPRPVSNDDAPGGRSSQEQVKALID